MTDVASAADHGFRADIEVIQSIAAIPSILTVVSRVTGMVLPRLRESRADRWVCLAVSETA